MSGTILRINSAREAIECNEEARGRLARIAGWAMERAEIHRSRTALRELSDAQLSDIGLTREQANLQGNLPWWR